MTAEFRWWRFRIFFYREDAKEDKRGRGGDKERGRKAQCGRSVIGLAGS
jgi:hypothetical protein